MNAAHSYTKDELADFIWLHTGRRPISVRSQALLVIATFDQNQIGVWRIEDLEVYR